MAVTPECLGQHLTSAGNHTSQIKNCMVISQKLLPKLGMGAKFGCNFGLTTCGRPQLKLLLLLLFYDLGLRPISGAGCSRIWLPRLTNRRLRFAGHCKRRKGSVVSNLITWQPTQGKRTAERPTKTYVDQLQANTGYTTWDIESCMENMQEPMESHHWSPSDDA